MGPLHTPLADVAVTSLSHFTTKGCATAIGEQPIKMLVDEESGARMAVGEALTNLVFAAVSDICDVKCSANWMWPAKLTGGQYVMILITITNCINFFILYMAVWWIKVKHSKYLMEILPTKA